MGPLVDIREIPRENRGIKDFSGKDIMESSKKFRVAPGRVSRKKNCRYTVQHVVTGTATKNAVLIFNCGAFLAFAGKVEPCLKRTIAKFSMRLAPVQIVNPSEYRKCNSLMLPQIFFVSWWRCTAGENEPGPDAGGLSAGSSLVVHQMAARAEAV
jgi:hypothetical protein